MIRQAFAGKIVLIGTNLTEEDRKRTPDRFMPPPISREATVAGCQLNRLGASDPGSGTSPGMFVHAAAVKAVMTGNIIEPVPLAWRAIAAGATAVGGTLLGFGLSPAFAVLGAAALVLTCLAAAPLLLGYGLWFQAVLPSAAAIVAMVVAYIVRFLIEERRRRRVQTAFGHYLAPVVVDQLVDSNTPLRLGGELREVTIMFADLSGFTALSGRVGPEELMAVTNSYLTIIVAAVEASGGYVDKFIGDAVMGIWGAPASNRDHAAGDAAAYDGLTGLASAFFYAGSRALLVSLWPVMSQASVAITTGTFAELKKSPTISRAEALRRSMMELADHPPRPEFAHPATWAPFILLGEGDRGLQ